MRAMVMRALKPPEPKKEKPKPGPVKSETRTGVGGVVTVTEGKKGGKRFLVFGFPVTAVVRWMGADAWLLEDAQKALNALGLADVELNTIKAQLLAGRKGERKPPAALSKDQEDTLYAVLEDSDGKQATGKQPATRKPERQAPTDRPHASAKGKAQVPAARAVPSANGKAHRPAEPTRTRKPTGRTPGRKVKPTRAAAPARKPPKTAPPRAGNPPTRPKPARKGKRAGNGR